MERKILTPTKKILILLTTLITLISCDYGYFLGTTDVDITFYHLWNERQLTFNNIQYVTENGDSISVDSLQYVISNIQLKSSNNFVHHIHHQFINVAAANYHERSIHFTEIPSGLYILTFVFGLKNEDNSTNIYTDLTKQHFNVSEDYGGGYYFMKLGGRYKNSNHIEQNYHFNTIRAVDTTNPQNLTFRDTSIEIQIDSIPISGYTNVEINVDIAKWFKNPNTWNIQTHNQQLENDFNAQIKMHENGQDVFSLGSVNN